MAYKQGSTTSGSGNIQKFSVSGIDGKTMAATKIGTAAQNFYPQFCRIIVENSTALTLAAGFSIGTNSPNYDNIMSSTTGGLSDTGDFSNFQLANPSIETIIAPGDIFINITSAATGTTYTLTAQVVGDY